MHDRKIQTINSAAGYTASIFGILAGLGGIVHGIGEVFQGNAVADKFFFKSWTEGPIAMYVDGDPAFSLIRNLLFTGILTLFISSAVIVWSIVFIKNKYSGLVLLLLSIMMLLFGGGVGPPVIGILAGIAGLGITSSYPRLRIVLTGKTRKGLALIWPWIYGVCVANGIFLVIGHVVAVYLFAPVRSQLFLNSFLLAVFLLTLSIITGIAYDLQNAKMTRRY
jgi:hypothetical protein